MIKVSVIFDGRMEDILNELQDAYSVSMPACKMTLSQTIRCALDDANCVVKARQNNKGLTLGYMMPMTTVDKIEAIRQEGIRSKRMAGETATMTDRELLAWIVDLAYKEVEP